MRIMFIKANIKKKKRNIFQNLNNKKFRIYFRKLMKKMLYKQKFFL